MTFSPFARYRNFTVANLKALLDVYPDMAAQLSWDEALELSEENLNGYKRTAYQQACQFGLEDREADHFRIQSYLYTFDDENLKRFLQFWIKTYFAPNPYIRSDDEPMLIYCELAKEILSAEDHKVCYEDFFSRRIGGGSQDILLNAIKAYGAPLRYMNSDDPNIHYFYIDPQNIEMLGNEVTFIEQNYPIPEINGRSEFFDRYSYESFCKFFGIVNRIPEDRLPDNPNTEEARKTGAQNILLYGVPGAGKSFTIQNKYCSDPRYIERVVFHPDYTYSDFVGQILPKVENGFLKYEFSAGPFTKVMKKAYEDPGNYYYLIIEELNRGNAPAIFGEIFQLLDRKEDEKYAEETIGESEYAITNYDIAEKVFGEKDIKVRIPSNLFILATMNTSDQNVFTLDTAFQRRWHMKHIRNDVRSAKHANMLIEGSAVDWGTFAEVINEEILKIADGMASLEDKRLGAYFVTGKELETESFSEKVLKYLWDDAFKMDHDYIFSEGMNSLDMVISAYQNAKDDRIGTVLRAGVYNEMIHRMQDITSQNGIISATHNN